MITKSTLKRAAKKALYYAALITFAQVSGCLQLWQSSNCWAEQTVTVYPGQNLQALVNQYGPSTTFILTPGIYYMQTIVPQSYDSFQGQQGAILSGAILLTSFAQNGAYWTAQVQLWYGNYAPGQCGPNPACGYPQDLFFNNVLKTRVTSLSAVVPGTWYLDYSTGTVYMGDNPNGSTVEISNLPYAFNGAATSVSISGLTIEKYACVDGTGAVNSGNGGTYWEVSHDEIRYNHAFGIQTGNDMYVHDSYVHTNGELGIGGQGSPVVVQSNEISYNNYAGYTIYNQAGGAKFTSAQDVTFQYNNVHNNSGPGFWVDINTQWVVCNENSFTANEEAGVFIETSSNATVSNNYIWNDGFNPDGTGIWWGAGILIADSTNVSVFFNTVSNSMNGIAGILSNRGNGPNGQPYTLQNVNVNSNWITQGTGIAAGICIEGTGFDNSVYTSWNNQFQYNTWNLSSPGGAYFYWMNAPMTMGQWGAALVAE